MDASELFTSSAAAIVKILRDKGVEEFLDLKFNNIPNATAMAVEAAAEMGGLDDQRALLR